MKITFAPRGIVQFEGIRITHKNFSGTPSKYNREGDRNFSIVIDDVDIAEALQKEGWNVRIKPPRDEDDAPFMYLPVKIKFNEYGPKVYLENEIKRVQLDEEMIDCLDHADIQEIEIDVCPYDWDVNGKTGRTAYLQAMYVVQKIDRFAARFAGEEYPGEAPF